MSEATKAFTLRLPTELFERLEEARGMVPRERWVRALIERNVAPARLPGMPRSSQSVKAGVTPITKKQK